MIPSIYCYLYLSSMWHTYGKMDDIPVAIVNHDQQLQYEGKTINVGYNLVEGLNKSDSLNYETVSDRKAESGIKSGKYYMVVTIPKDFSKNTTTLLTSHPKQLHLYYRLNSGRNFIILKMTTGTATAITNKVSKQVTQMYSTILLSTLSKVTNGLANIKYTKIPQTI
ncbi:YhgE/Pip domain-containing protein [Leuconostoc gelidum]|uniref:YhgE/Pip domain-containing protein n=1 Tax=Leuconostoc gelidum TaxID=1244 RepID=UPI002180ACDE|nr:YhgE/Pip domain-containing protein [Leuconostoc gelidum]